MNKVLNSIPPIVIMALLCLSGAYRSAPFAYAAVLALGLLLLKNGSQELLVAKTAKTPQADEVLKRAVQDLNARITTIEYAQKQRGF